MGASWCGMGSSRRRRWRRFGERRTVTHCCCGRKPGFKNARAAEHRARQPAETSQVSVRYARRPDVVNVFFRKRILREPCTSLVTLGAGAPGAFTRRRCGGTSRARSYSTARPTCPPGAVASAPFAPTPSVSRLVRKLLGALLDLLTAE